MDGAAAAAAAAAAVADPEAPPLCPQPQRLLSGQGQHDHGEKQPLLSTKDTPQQPQEPQEPQPHTTTPKPSIGILQDLCDTILLAIPLFASTVSWVGMKTTDSALLGHVSAEALAAASLSDLWTMCTAPLLSAGGGVLAVLIGGAVGAGNPKLAGIYLQVSYLALSAVLLVVFIAWNATEFVWRVGLGADAHLARMAGYFSRVLSLSLPAQVAYSQLAQFFSAQRIMRPEVTASLCGLAANLVLGLYLVLGITPWTFLFHDFKEQEAPPPQEPPPQEPPPLSRWPGYGFVACPIVTASVTVVQFLVLYLVYCHVLQLHAPAWGGWSWREVTSTGRLVTYWHLYVPAALSLASDFWRVAVIGTIAVRRLGEYQVAIFNTSYRIMWIVMILSNALATASSIKTTMRLGRGDVKGARRATYVGLGLAAAILAGLAGLVYYHIRALGRIFTNDPVLLDLLADAALPFTVTLLLMNFAVALERVPFSMGRTQEVFWYGFIASWAFQVPAVMVLTTYWRNDLAGLYTGMAIGYFVLVVLYGAMVVQSDWEKYAADARQRSEMPPPSS